MKSAGVKKGTNVRYTDQPSGDKAENCAHVRLQDAHAGKWGDAPCSDTYYYICERGF